MCPDCSISACRIASPCLCSDDFPQLHQGSGKGTLSARLVQKYNLEFVASGDVLRREIMNKTEIGRSAEEIVAAGGLLPDELMLDMIMAELDKLHGKVGRGRRLCMSRWIDTAQSELDPRWVPADARAGRSA